MTSQNIYNELYVSDLTGGGPGGDPFVFSGGNEGVFLSSLIFYASNESMKAVRIELSNGSVLTRGNIRRPYDRIRLDFNQGEKFTRIQVFSINPDAPVVGSIEINTTTGVKEASPKDFRKDAKNTISPPTEIPVGTGDCVGVIGRAGSRAGGDLNCIGFSMLTAPRPAYAAYVKEK